MRRQQQNKPMRRCIGCYTSFPQDELIRMTLVGNRIVPDTEGKSEGRGMYLCRNEKCLHTAVKKRVFNRVCRMDVDVENSVQAIEKLINSTKEE